MKVKLLVSRAVIGDSQNVGDEIEVSDAEALAWLRQAKQRLFDPLPSKQLQRNLKLKKLTRSNYE